MHLSELCFDKITIRKLKLTDDLSSFRCDHEDEVGCDDFIHKEEEAKLFQKERQGITYLFFYKGNIIGYVTLAMSSINAERVEESLKEPIRLRFYPSLLIGRLAVDNNWRKKGVGKFLCDWCLGFAIELSEKVGCRYVVLETNESKVGFYLKCGFLKALPLEDEEIRLIWMYQRTVLE